MLFPRLKLLQITNLHIRIKLGNGNSVKTIHIALIITLKIPFHNSCITGNNHTLYIPLQNSTFPVPILSLLSKKFGVSLYSGDKHPLLTAAKQCGRVDYNTEMPFVFKCSDINLNITLKCLQTGIPLRALDIMGCGGFLLSNYQEEFLDYFVPNEDFVYYEDFKDAYAKADFYLKNDDLRKQIAQNGYEKIKKYFSYEDRFQFMTGQCPFMQ